MTNMESLYGSGKFTEIMQSVKLTAIKKITAEEVEFYTSKERFDIHGQLWISPALSPIRYLSRNLCGLSKKIFAAKCLVHSTNILM